MVAKLIGFIVGDTAVGKSCLVVRFVRDEFFEFQEPTIGGMYMMGISVLSCVCSHRFIWKLYSCLYNCLFIQLLF